MKSLESLELTMISWQEVQKAKSQMLDMNISMRLHPDRRVGLRGVLSL